MAVAVKFALSRVRVLTSTTSRDRRRALLRLIIALLGAKLDSTDDKKNNKSESGDAVDDDAVKVEVDDDNIAALRIAFVDLALVCDYHAPTMVCPTRERMCVCVYVCVYVCVCVCMCVCMYDSKQIFLKL